LLVIVVTLLYRGLISPDENHNSRMPSLGVAFIMPGMALLIRALTDFSILHHPPFLWVAMVVISIVLSFFYMLPAFKPASKPMRIYGTGILMIFLSLFYSYGLLVETNCLLDNAVPVEYQTIVNGKRVSSGKTTTYYLDLKPWGKLSGIQEVIVTRQEYESISAGDSLAVHEHVGALGIPWVEIVI